MIFCDQDMMDELLQSLYPVYSMAREFSNPYKVNITTISAMNCLLSTIARLCETTVSRGQDRR